MAIQRHWQQLNIASNRAMRKTTGYRYHISRTTCQLADVLTLIEKNVVFARVEISETVSVLTENSFENSLLMSV